MNRKNWLLLALVAIVGCAVTQRACAVSATATGGYTLMNYALGGTNFNAFIFTTNGTFTVSDPGSVEVLVVAGGGGGGCFAGGGGAGGLIYTNGMAVTAGVYAVTVGGGGSGGQYSGSLGTGTNGGNSVFGTRLTTYGGGGGGSRDNGVSGGNNGASGGSGGGGSPSDTQLTYGGSATSGQGNAGGNGSTPAASANWAGAGGGGAGAAGGNATGNGGTCNAGTGGVGVAYNLAAGTNVYYAGGGGGGNYSGGGNAAPGGLGGGGGGSKGNGSPAGTNGVANTGGGGGGGAYKANGGTGGSGIVIVRYGLSVLPTWTGLAVSNLTTTSAMASATLSGTNADVYLFWDTQDDGQTHTAWANTNFPGSNMSIGLISGVVISNLTVGQTYYFRFYGTNTTSGLTGWSSPSTFNTGEITVTATVASVSEAGPGSGQFTVYRPANLTNSALTVNFTIGGTAVAGTDYQTLASSTSVTIPAGSNGATISVTPIDNTLADGNRTVTLTLQPGGYLMGASSNATVTIVDEEISPSAFSYKAQITFGGYSQSEALTNFPVLLVFSTNAMTNFSYSQLVSTNGYDLAFYDNSVPPRRLNYEVEKWDPTTNSLLWVQVPVLSSGTIIWAYWGNAATASAPAFYTTNGAAWSSDYVLVHHLAGTNGTTISDSTTNRFNGTVQNSSDTALAAGKAGTGLSLGPTGYYNLPNIGSRFGSSATLMFWIKANDSNGGRGFAWLDQCGLSSHYPYDSNIYMGTWRGSRISWSASSLDRTQWHLVTVTTPDPATGNWRFYQNATVANESAPSAFTLPTTPNIGGTGYSTLYLQATIDEVRISNVARSSNYVWACYMTVASNNVFASYSAEQPVVADEPIIQNVAAQSVQSNAAVLVGNLQNAAATVTCYWGTNDGGQVASAWMTNTPMGASMSIGYITNSMASGLLPGTIYYFRYYATNNAGDCWASSAAFCTLGGPTVNNGIGASPVHQRSATLNGTLVAGNPAPSVWIYWGTGDGGTTKGAWNGGALSVGTNAFGSSFSSPLLGLQPNQLYCYRSYASNTSGDAWAPASANFTTLAQPPPFTIAADGDRALNNGASLVADSAAQSITPSGSNPYLYDWHNSNGAGDSAGDGLAMGNRKITTTDGSSIVLKLDNVNGNGAITGASPSVAFFTYHGQALSGSIAISNASSIAIGGIDTHADSTAGPKEGGGAVTIGMSGAPIPGNVRIDSIDTDVRNRGTGYDNGGSAGGAVTIYGSGDVMVRTSGGTLGNIDAHSVFSAGGSVNIQHHGSFEASNVDTRAHTVGHWAYESSGSATFNGAFGGSAAGSFQVNNINTTHLLGGNGGVAGAISIQGYTGVTVAAGLLATNDDGAAGNISITNISGDIAIAGPISARGTTMGNLTLQAGGSITLTNLDLSQVQYALLQFGGVSWLNGVLTGTNGLAAAGLSNIGTSLRTPAGSVVRYGRTANPALGGQTFTLANASGTAGTGGFLRPWPAGGSAVFFR